MYICMYICTYSAVQHGVAVAGAIAGVVAVARAEAYDLINTSKCAQCGWQFNNESKRHGACSMQHAAWGMECTETEEKGENRKGIEQRNRQHF